MKISITGFNGGQYGNSTSNRKGILNFSELIIDILKDCGHEVGHNLEDADLNFVFVIDPSSINAGHIHKALPILRNKPSIVVFDDWNVKSFYRTVDGIVEKGKFSKTHHTVDYKVILEYKDVFEKIANGEYISLFPAYNVGDHSLLGIRGEAYSVDPSIYIEDRRKFNENNREVREYLDLIPVNASLANKFSELSKKKYSFLNLKGKTEEEVFDYYQKYRMVMTPKHDHDGSGWFRVRYMMAILAEAIIVDDKDSIFGSDFEVDPKNVSKDNIEEIYESQRSSLYNTIMTKQEVQEEINNVIEKFKDKQ